MLLHRGFLTAVLHENTMAHPNATRLKRAPHPMPAFVREALQAHGLQAAYDARPPYQRNDYLGWIGRAKREATRQKRLDQMLAELKGGTTYMNMDWPGAGRKAPEPAPSPEETPGDA